MAPNPDALRDLLQDARIFRSNGQLLPPSDNIWVELSQKLKGAMSPKYIWVFLNSNRHHVAEDLRQARGLPGTMEKEKTIKKAPSAADRPSKKFKIKIPAETWEKIKPVKTTTPRGDRPGKTRTTWALAPNSWAGAVAELMWDQHRIPCPLVFKRAHVNSAGDKFVTLEEGHCHECGATAQGYIRVRPEEGLPVLLIVRATDTINVPHTTRRQLRGVWREELGEAAEQVGTSEIRRKRAHSKVDDEMMGPTMYTAQVIQKAKQEVKTKKLAIPPGYDQLDKLLKMKYSTHLGSIHFVGLDPIVVIYWVPLQQQIHNTLKQMGYYRVSIDATGTVVMRIERPDGHLSRHIFLYQMEGHNGVKGVPVNQLLSERQDATIITFWLNDSLRRDFKIPDEAVMDDSPALISAVARSLAGCTSAQDYKGKCFAFLKGVTNVLPRCFIRKDLAHFINRARTWKLWHSVNNNLVKKHCLHFLGLLIQSDSLEAFRSNLKSFLVILHAPTMGITENGEMTPAEVCKKNLVGQVCNVDLEDSVAMEENDDSEDGNEEDDEDTAQMLQAINEEAQLEAEEEGDGLNPYRCQPLANKLLKISQDFVMWSAVMVQPFNSPYPTATSAHNEGSFSDLKNNVFRNDRLPQPLSNFTAIHLNSLEGQVATIFAEVSCKKPTRVSEDEEDVDTPDSPDLTGKESKSPQAEENKPKPSKGALKRKLPSNSKKQENTEKKPSSQEKREEEDMPVNDTPPDIDESKAIENWRGLGTDNDRTKSKSKYLNKAPEVGLALENTRLKEPKKPLLRNGSSSGFQILGDSKVEVKRTCGFDSLAQLVAVCIIDEESFREYALTKRDQGEKSLLDIGWMLAHEGAVNNVYNMRAEILSKSASLIAGGTLAATRSHKKPITLLTYDCNDDLSHIISGIRVGFASETVVYVCPEGHRTTEERSCVDVNSKYLMEHGFRRLADAIVFHSYDKGKLCIDKSCMKRMEANEISFGSSLLIDTGFLNRKDPRVSLRIKLQDLPKEVKVNGENYKLKGVVAYTPGHFIACTYRARGVWEVFDDCSRKPYVMEANKKVLPHCFLFVKQG